MSGGGSQGACTWKVSDMVLEGREANDAPDDDDTAEVEEAGGWSSISVLERGAPMWPVMG